MSHITRAIDRTGWARGEWDNEPDRFDFIHAGFSCFILRNHTGNWCGYVGVPRGHQAYGLDDSLIDMDVHGGLTYSGRCNGEICHTPQEGMPDDVWWLGFDTAHYMDLSPAMLRRFSHLYGSNEIYKNMQYVIDETKKLADQLAGGIHATDKE